MSSPDERLRELERKALEGGPEDLVAFVKAAMYMVDIALESANSLLKAEAEAKAMISSLKEEQDALLAKVMALHERADKIAALQNTAGSRHSLSEYDLVPCPPHKEHMDTVNEYEETARRVTRFAYMRPEPHLEVDPWSVDLDGWPKVAGDSAKPPRAQYCPDDEFKWRALVLEQFNDLSDAIRKLAKILHDARVIDAPWTELRSLY